MVEAFDRSGGVPGGAPWEREFRESEESQLNRSKKGEPIKGCTDCLPEMECTKVWFINDIRLVSFPLFGNRTFAPGRIEDCPYLKSKSSS